MKSGEILPNIEREKILRTGPYEERGKGGKEGKKQRRKDKRERNSM